MPRDEVCPLAHGARLRCAFQVRRAYRVRVASAAIPVGLPAPLARPPEQHVLGYAVLSRDSGERATRVDQVDGLGLLFGCERPLLLELIAASFVDGQHPFMRIDG